jgi:hypothetical protein
MMFHSSNSPKIVAAYVTTVNQAFSAQKDPFMVRAVLRNICALKFSEHTLEQTASELKRPLVEVDRALKFLVSQQLVEERQEHPSGLGQQGIRGGSPKFVPTTEGTIYFEKTLTEDIPSQSTRLVLSPQQLGRALGAVEDSFAFDYKKHVVVPAESLLLLRGEIRAVVEQARMRESAYLTDLLGLPPGSRADYSFLEGSKHAEKFDMHTKNAASLQGTSLPISLTMHPKYGSISDALEGRVNNIHGELRVLLSPSAKGPLTTAFPFYLDAALKGDGAPEEPVYCVGFRSATGPESDLWRIPADYQRAGFASARNTLQRIIEAGKQNEKR